MSVGLLNLKKLFFFYKSTNLILNANTPEQRLFNEMYIVEIKDPNNACLFITPF